MTLVEGTAATYARIHPGPVFHTMDHYVLDVRDPAGGAAYFTVYSIGHMPEVGTGHIAFLRVRTEQGETPVDVTLAEDPAAGRRMQSRLRKLVATTDTSRGIGTDLESEPLVATFERLPWVDGRAGYRVRTDDLVIEAEWSDGEEPIFVAAPRPSFHDGRDIVGTMIAFWAARLTVDGNAIAGEPYADEWWHRRLGRPFSSCHMSLGDTSMEPADGWW